MLGGNPISWRTKNQDTVSHSSDEDEYRAIAAATKELNWIIPLMKELCIEVTKPVSFYCDSKTAIYIAANMVFHEHKKHIERDCHYVRDAVKAGIISTTRVRTKE